MKLSVKDAISRVAHGIFGGLDREGRCGDVEAVALIHVVDGLDFALICQCAGWQQGHTQDQRQRYR